MTVPFNPNPQGAPAPGQGSFPMPPGQGTFQAPVPQQPAQIIREGGWSGYPASALPPMPQPQVQQPLPGQQGFQQQPVPQYQPQPQQGWPQQAQPIQAGQQIPTQFTQPQTQPGQQFQQALAPQQQAPQGGSLDPNMILQGPQFPAELQGVSLGQAIQLYGGMRNLVLNLQQRAPQNYGPPPAQQQGQQAPQGQQQGQPGQQQQQPFDWRNPLPAIQQAVEQVVARQMQPMQEQAQFSQAANARAQVAQELGPQRFAQLEPHITRYLAGADPASLANPDMWRVAARTAIGELTLSGGFAPAPQQQPQYPQQGGAVPFRPGMQNPAPSLQSFFTEAPQQGAQAVQGVTLTPQQMWFADQMGVPYADYAAYSQGVPQNLPNGGRR